VIKKFSKGFTLIELMIVVAIIGILAAIAIPNFIKFQCRSKQSEAKANLKALMVAQESYRGENDTYLDGTCTGGKNVGTAVCDAGAKAVGFQPKGKSIRYNVSTTGATATTFIGDATANSAFQGELDGDQWIIDQDGKLNSAVNFCENG
jgi:type IV pilus assembly protein PilA